MAIDARMNSEVARPTQSLLYNPELRSYAYQIITVLVVAFLIYQAWTNAAENLAKANMSAGFGFLSGRAGFDLSQALISFSSDSSYLRALEVGFLNTLLVAVLGIITATIVGILVGVGRLSQNWLIARLCTVYVEVFRNIPPLLVIFFWYLGVLALLPTIGEFRDGITAAKAADPSYTDPVFFIINRGIHFPAPVTGDNFIYVWAVLALGIIGSIIYARWAKSVQVKTGKQSPILLVSLGLIIGLPLIVFLVLGAPLTFDYPVLGRFNSSGGFVIPPEFLSLYLALSFYTAAFIAEIVRAGIRGVYKGQSEAAGALGLRPGKTMRLVVLPQAMRIIIPPTGNQFIAMLKDSSLVSVVGVWELMYLARTQGQTEFRHIEMLFTASMIYWIMSIGLELIQARIEKRFNRSVGR